MQHRHAVPLGRRIGLVLVLPLVFAALGAWQLDRAAADAVGHDAEAAGLEAMAAELAPIAAVTPNRPIPMSTLATGTALRVPALRALELVRDGARHLRQDAVVARLRQGAAVATLAGGTLALLVGAAGLAMAARVDRRARASRAELVERFGTVRRWLPALLGIQVAGLCLAVSAAVLFEAGGAWYLHRVGTGELKLVGLAVVLAGAVLYIAWVTLRDLARTLASFTPDPLPVLGRAVDARTAPGLWAMVSGMAAQQGAPPPDHIVAGIEAGFFVTSSVVELQPERALLHGRTLHVPLPMLALLDREEVAVVVTHELAHFTGEDTAYTQGFLPVYAGIGRSLSAVGNVYALERFALLPAATLGRHMMEVFEAAVNHWSRLRELAADAASVPADGAGPVGSVLVRSGLVGTVTDAVLTEAAEHPRTAPPDLVARMVERAQPGFGDVAQLDALLDERAPHPTDTHPPTRQRIAAVGLPVDDALLARAARPPGDTAFARGLFQDWTGLCTTLSADFLGLAAEQEDAYVDALQDAAGHARGTTEVFQSTRRMQVGVLLAEGILLVGVAVVGWVLLERRQPIALDDPVVLAGLAMLLGAGVAAGLAVWLPRRMRAPFLVLRPDGFACRGLDREVPWLGVETVDVIVAGAFSTVFVLTPETTLPQRVSGWAARVHRRKRTITLVGLVPGRMTLQEYVDLIYGYLNAARARDVLARRDAEPGPA